MAFDRVPAPCPSPDITTLTRDVGTFGAASADLLLSDDEAARFAVLRTTLPDGWVLDLQGNAGMAWVAFVHKAEAPGSRPMFTVCRWSDRVGLFAQWEERRLCSATAFSELWPVLELILDGIFAATQAGLATVPTEGWAKDAALTPTEPPARGLPAKAHDLIVWQHGVQVHYAVDSMGQGGMRRPGEDVGQRLGISRFQLAQRRDRARRRQA